MIELLKQPQFSPFSIDRQVASIWAGTTGQLDEVPVADIRRFEDEFLEYLSLKHKGTLDTIRETGNLTDEDLVVFKDAIGEFKKGFTTSSGQSLAKEAAVAAMDDENVDQEKITKVKRA
jgi:F-type H+-transporting ATPase subunit alpha